MRWVLLALVSCCGQGWAATPFKHSLTGKKDSYLSDGVFTGGHAKATGSSILAVRHSFSAKAELERIVIALGDKEAKPLTSGPSYFQASIDKVNQRVVVDISQLKLSLVSEAQVQRLFKKSPYVKTVSLTLDPEDKAASMVVELKRPMRLEVFQLQKPARIVLDLSPLRSGRS